VPPKPEPSAPVPRGRHAPPLEVRRSVQRGRLYEAAAAVFCRVGYAEASAEAISREAGMSKATFYEHFANKEECILALFDEAAKQVLGAVGAATSGPGDTTDSYPDRVARRLEAFLDQVAAHPDAAQTLLVEIIGAGPQAIQRRDQVLDVFAEVLHRDNAENAPALGWPTFASREDALAVVGAIAELVARHLRTGDREEIRSVAPTLQRLILGILEQNRQP
jgi:AcrR family transcriptional regulator